MLAIDGVIAALEELARFAAEQRHRHFADLPFARRQRPRPDAVAGI
jgi:hypothetical protein